MVPGVAVEHDRPGGRDDDCADLVEREPPIDLGRHGAARLLQKVDARGVQRPLVHPHDLRLEAARGVRRSHGEDVPTTDIELVGEDEGH